jgi:hypothetical protein
MPAHAECCARCLSWLRRCVTSWKVAGSIPMLSYIRPHYGPASKRNEYQDYFLRGKGGICMGMTSLQYSYAAWFEVWKPQNSGIFVFVKGAVFLCLYPGKVRFLVKKRKPSLGMLQNCGKVQYATACVSLFLSVLLSTRNNSAPSGPIFMLEYFRQSVERIQVSLKSDKNDFYFTWRSIYSFDHISLSSS